jgi:putative addiction module killer protein
VISQSFGNVDYRIFFYLFFDNRSKLTNQSFPHTGREKYILATSGIKNIDNLYPRGYNWFVNEIRKTDTYARWLDSLRDIHARACVLARVERLAAGNPGDVKPVGEGVSELRIDYGPGYRVYFTMRGRTVIILLAGGDKRTQATDIKTALRLARNL